MTTPLHVVTGALGYTGRAVAERLVERGARVRTLTNSPGRPNPLGARLEIHPMRFDRPDELARSMEGAAALYNTYWVRYPHRRFDFGRAVSNTRVLFEAARRAGVGRIVHVSVLHADEADDLAYYRGKHELEDALRASGQSHAIARPGVLFGRGDILVNNMAWVLRRLPLVGVFGRGDCALRPLHVDDMAALLVGLADRGDSPVVDAVGPERYTYVELLRMLAGAMGVRRALVRVPPTVGVAVARALGPLVGDVMVTREEVAALVRGLLDSGAPAAGPTSLRAWAEARGGDLGQRYASEVRRRVRLEEGYSTADVAAAPAGPGGA